MVKPIGSTSNTGYTQSIQQEKIVRKTTSDAQLEPQTDVDTRRNKINDISERIDQKTYSVSSQEVAKAFLLY